MGGTVAHDLPSRATLNSHSDAFAHRAVNRAVDSVNGAVKDPEVRDGANRAVTSLADALSTSFGEVSHQVRDALRRDKGSGSAPTG